MTGVAHRRTCARPPEWRERLARHIGPATRAFFREYLDEAVRFTPILEERRRGYRFEGAIGIGGVACAITVEKHVIEVDLATAQRWQEVVRWLAQPKLSSVGRDRLRAMRFGEAAFT